MWPNGPTLTLNPKSQLLLSSSPTRTPPLSSQRYSLTPLSLGKLTRTPIANPCPHFCKNSFIKPSWVTQHGKAICFLQGHWLVHLISPFSPYFPHESWKSLCLATPEAQDFLQGSRISRYHIKFSFYSILHEYIRNFLFRRKASQWLYIPVL